MLTCWYETHVFYLLLYQLSYPQRFWGHGVPFCTDLRAAGGTSVYLKVTRRGFLLRRQPRWSSVLRWLVTSDQQKSKELPRPGWLCLIWIAWSLWKIEDDVLTPDGVYHEKSKAGTVDSRWRWSTYINASYSASLGRDKVFPPESLRCDDSPIAFVSMVGPLFFPYFCVMRTLSRKLFFRQHIGISGTPLGIMMNKGALVLL